MNEQALIVEFRLCRAVASQRTRDRSRRLATRCARVLELARAPAGFRIVPLPCDPEFESVSKNLETSLSKRIGETKLASVSRLVTGVELRAHRETELAPW